MVFIQENSALLPFNTFKFNARARYLSIISSLQDLSDLRGSHIFTNQPRLFLGGGSNILFTRDFDGLVIRNEIKGISVLREDSDTITLKVGSGENWHSFVMYCVDRNYGGVENLSLIPGTIGAAPMQNIGAYGVEVKNVINEVDAMEISTGQMRNFTNQECQFGYRESFFKHEGKDRYFISSVTLTLTKRNHQFNVSYGAIKDTLAQMGVTDLSVKAISDAVIAIRRSKLPDPAVIGNAGSFFKNPSVDSEKYASLKEKFPAIPGFTEENHKITVPAGWLIEQCGWKGKRFDNIGVHPLQALVLVHYGGDEGKKLWQLALDIQSSVKQKFNIELQPEVNVI
ncbi:MAG TPA: UDP-N-acetylmuramate dehydrogenase [Sphingobacteriaceae bacterium]